MDDLCLLICKCIVRRCVNCPFLPSLRPFPKPQRKSECLKALKQIAVEPGGKYMINELYFVYLVVVFACHVHFI